MSYKMFNIDSNILIRSTPDTPQIDHVPAAVYRIIEDSENGQVLLIKDRERFNVPDKCYGTHNVNKKAILDAWSANKGSTGAILKGIKGTGKSLLAEDLGNSMIQRDIPVIMVDRAVSRAALNLVTRLAAPCMVYFDEFGKIFKESDRRDLLTYFSDSSFNKVLFVVTSNAKKELDKYMLDRPGRFLFRIDYPKLDSVAISEMLDDHGVRGEMATLMNSYVHYREITFDMLRFLAPIAASSKDIMEFNSRISILNVPAPIYPFFEPTSILYKGEPWYGHYNQTTSETFNNIFTLSSVGVEKPIASGSFYITNIETTKVQVLSEDQYSREVQIFLKDLVIIGNLSFTSGFKNKNHVVFADPAQKREEKGSGDDSHVFSFDSLFSHRRQPGISDEEKSLIEMAKFIVENHKKEESVSENQE